MEQQQLPFEHSSKSLEREQQIKDTNLAYDSLTGEFYLKIMKKKNYLKKQKITQMVSQKN